MNFRRILAILMTVLMLAGMMSSTGLANAICDKCTWGPVEWDASNGCGTRYGLQYCSVCGNSQQVSEDVEHNWGPWHGILDVPCGGEAMIWRECSNCGKMDEKLHSREHVPGQKTYPLGMPSNCEEWTYWEISCTECGECLETDEIQGDHKWTTNRVVDPTCTEDGWDETICSVCGDEAGDKESVPALGHDFGDWMIEQEGNCITPHSEARTCSRCGVKERRSDNYGDHKWGEWHVVKEPTYNEEGREERECTVCGIVEGRPIPVKATSAPTVNPTATPTATVTINPTPTPAAPTANPTEAPTANPTEAPTANPTEAPTANPTEAPTANPTEAPTEKPTEKPTAKPTEAPTANPTEAPTANPTEAPTAKPTEKPTAKPTDKPTAKPTKKPTEAPTETPDVVVTEAPVVSGGIVLTKSVVSTADYYYSGDTVTFAITIENTSNETYYDVIVYDPIFEYAEMKSYDMMEPGYSDTIQFDYVVTSADVINGSVENTAFVLNPNGADAQDRIYSNTVSVKTAAETFTFDGTEYQLGGLEVSKEVFASLPVNGQYFTPGETVSYAITVKNICGRTLHEVTVRDSLYSDTDPVAIFPDMQPGDTFTASFGYRVTEMDAIRGYVKNIASVVGYDPEGKVLSALTNEVEILTGMEGDFPFGVITEMTIVKEETSTPANGSYYTEGETISYQITYTNSGETDFGETLIYDTLSEGMDEIASAEMLTSGDSRICYFTHVVTADDVAKGYVANSAIAKYDIGGGYTNTAISNVVVSDTDGDPNTTYAPDTGEIDWEKLRGTEGAVEDTCYIKAVSRDGDSVEYEVHFCTKHAQTQNSILTMAKEATTPETQQMVWEYAYALWQNEIDAMYQEILPACDDAAKITVMSERVTHLSMVANTQFALKIAEPGQPAETAYAVAQLWQDKCIDLCYLMNTAPSARVDSIFGVERALNEAEIYEDCSCVITEEAEGEILCADQYCPLHGFTYGMMELLLLSDNSLETWATVRSLWEIELNISYNALYKDASEEGGMAYLAEYAAYLTWLPAYEQFITMIYPENPEIVAEVMVNTIMERALDNCGRIK